MQLITLINVTIFQGEWNGIVLFLHTALFVTVLAFYTMTKNEK
ncbi:hypothetical protein KP78_25840 [Jeotgalibacillus soli]|uniref:Uncharacterized protein n=2 Tax=Jeotgalibacillus soli TaxID=889306 RepID=A0A0C2R480_9BACL|nr:hypothetical protein KP78_25840 [Jeotgalibacillus soli]